MVGDAFIVAIGRTAGARRGGKLSSWHPADLGGLVVDAVLERAGVDAANIDDVIFGCVGQVGQQAGNIARNVVLSSSLPESVPGASVDRQCGSSQQALHFAAQAVMSGTQDVVIAGGVESMTRVPMGSAVALAATAGMGGPRGDAMARRYPGVKFSQFTGAEMIAEKRGFSREQLDAFGYDSQRKAGLALQTGAFAEEIIPVPLEDGTYHLVDEGVRSDTSLEALTNLKTIGEAGRLTAGTSSQICDGASAVVVVNEAGLRKVGAAPLARIHHLSVYGGDPVIMLEAPIAATHRALKRAGMRIGDISLYEVNEAFASVPLAWLKELDASPDRLNVHGGAIALGHPLGASGTRLISTLISALHRCGGRYGLQTMCEGGGLANVTIIERL